MQILFVAPYVPNRIRVRSYQLLRVLVRRGHNVTLLAVYSSAEERDSLDELARLGVDVNGFHLSNWRSAINCAMSLRSGRPFQSDYSWSSQLASRLYQLIDTEDYDVIHIEHLRGSRYGLQFKDQYLLDVGNIMHSPARSIPIVWDSVDCISHLFERAATGSRSLKGRLMTRAELGRTKKYEGRLVNLFDTVLVTSAVDREALLGLAAEYAKANSGTHKETDKRLEDKVTVLPNGVDLDYFGMNGSNRAKDRIVFTGKMSYHANITAALYLVKEIMPLVWAQKPDVDVYIVGKDPTAALQALGADERVTVTGEVPDIREFLQQATISVAPMPYGAGIQNKVLEAMACGAPVVASPQAVSALSIEPERDCLVADGAEAFAHAIFELLESPARRESLRSAGRLYVETHHAWDEIGAQLENIYASVMPTGIPSA